MKKTKPPHHPKVWAIRFRDGDLSMATYPAEFEARSACHGSSDMTPVQVRLVPEAEYQKMVRAMEGKA